MSQWPQRDSRSTTYTDPPSPSVISSPLFKPFSRPESTLSRASDDNRSLVANFPQPPSGPYFRRISPVQSERDLYPASDAASKRSSNTASSLRSQEHLLDPDFINSLLAHAAYEPLSPQPFSPLPVEDERTPLQEPVGFGARRQYVDAPVRLSLGLVPHYDPEPVPYSPTIVSQPSIRRPPSSVPPVPSPSVPSLPSSRFSMDSARSEAFSEHTISGDSAETVSAGTVRKAIVARRSKPVFAPLPDGWKKWRDPAVVDPSSFPDPNTFPKPYPFSPNEAGPSNPRPSHSPKQRSQSSRSARSNTKRVSGSSSYKSGFSSVSRSTSKSSRRWDFFRRKPLPPLPYDMPESEMALPVLVERAGVLSDMLEAGHLPYQSRPSTVYLYGTEERGYTDEKALKRSKSVTRSVKSFFSGKLSNRSRHKSIDGGRNGVFSKLREDLQRDEKSSQKSGSSQGSAPKVTPTIWRVKKRTFWISFFALLVLVAVVLGIALGVTMHHHSSAGQSVPLEPFYTCNDGNMTGVLCNLDATCVCTSTEAGRCNPLSTTLVTLAPIASQLFNTTMDPNALALNFWNLQGTPQQNCSAQVLTVDVGHSINVGETPQRGEWAESALLYNLFMTEDLNGTVQMQKFISSLYFASFPSDGPTSLATNASAYVFHGAGYNFDFAELAITAPNVTWVADQNPPASQTAEIGPVAEGALDRMYTFASASSSQESTALQLYWTRTLQRNVADLPTFISAIAQAPVTIPFDATSSHNGIALSTMYPTSATSGSFPIPISCYPGLNATDLQAINSIETTVFGLPPVPSTTATYNTSCIPDRPIYGVLDILRLRLAFDDSFTGVPLQAASLTATASSRAAVHLGITLSSFPRLNDTSPWPSSATDPREYGTLSHMDHVVLSFLQSLPSTSAATTIVNYVLSATSSSPPLTNSTLDIPVSAIPVIEVAFFGSISNEDLAFSSSSFSTDSGGLFFGSASGQSFRQWALLGNASQLVWTNSSTAVQVVREGTDLNEDFEAVWSGSTNLINAITSAGDVTDAQDVGEVVSALESFGSFGP